MNDDDSAKAFGAGLHAALDGEELNRNPYSVAQGSPTRPLAIAWKRGWRKGQAQLELDEQERAGHFKTVKS